MNITLGGIILAGGRSSRMGTNKGLMLYKSEPMIAHSIRLLEHFTKSIIISSNSDEYKKFNYPVVKDISPEIGPMGGLQSGLKASSCDHNIVLPCDSPDLTVELIQLLIDNYDGNRILIAETSTGPHPLIGIYPKTAAYSIEESIIKDVFTMREFLQENSAKTLFFDDLYEKFFGNYNTLKDFE